MGPELNDNSPGTVHWLTYLWVWIMAIIGSVVGQLNEAREDRAPVKIMDFLAHNVTAAFVGTLVFYLFESVHANPFLAAACIGMSGNMSRSVYRRFIIWSKAALDRWLPGVEDDEE